MGLGYSLHLWRSPTGCRPPTPSKPLPLRVAKACRNNLNNEITPLLPTGIGERYSQTISCADVNSPVYESAELTQGALYSEFITLSAHQMFNSLSHSLVLTLCGLYTTVHMIQPRPKTISTPKTTRLFLRVLSLL
jgi:hypothetical protein